jgi:hypothetical protein
MIKRKYKGIVFLTASGSSGEFLSNFLSLCANKNVSYHNMNIGIVPNNTLFKFNFPSYPYNKIQQKCGWNDWRKCDISDLNETFFKNFKNDYVSMMHMHIPWCDMEFYDNNNYIKFFYILKLLNEFNIKIYYVNFYSNYVASYVYCVRALTRYDDSIYPKYLKSQKNKKYYSLEIDTMLLHQELIIKALLNHNIDYETINLDNLLLNRDFDGLYNQIKNSYDLERKLPDEYKQIVNKMWDDRIETLKELNML